MSIDRETSNVISENIINERGSVRCYTGGLCDHGVRQVRKQELDKYPVMVCYSCRP